MINSTEQLPAPFRQEGGNGRGHGADPASATRVDVTAVRKEVEFAPAPSAGPKDFGDMLKMLHRALRGRIILTTTLALLAGGLGVYAGWRIGAPTYHSESLLRIAYTLPQVMQQTDQNAPVAMFDTVMQSQVMLIDSRRVIDRAMQDPIWRQYGRQIVESADRYFADHLSVDIKPRSEFILIKVTDSDPFTAAAAVTAVSNAYQDIYREEEARLERTRTGTLSERQRSSKDALDSLIGDLEKKSKEYGFGTSDLEPFYEQARMRVAKLEDALSDANLASALGVVAPPNSVAPANAAPANAAPGNALANAAGAANATGSAIGAQVAAATQPGQNEAFAVTRIPETPEQIATAGDGEMRRRLDDLEQREAELIRIKKRFGTAHQTYLDAEFGLEQAKRGMESYAQLYHDFLLYTGRNINAAGGRGGVGMAAARSPAELQASLTEHLKAARADMVQRGDRMRELKSLVTKIGAAREDLDKINKRLEVLNAEQATGGRLIQLSSGTPALAPDRDPRLKFAAVGGTAGLILPLSFMVTLGLMRRRYEFSDEPEADIAVTAPLLGILPNLKGNDDAEKRLSAARCVHQIRVLLRTRADRRRCSIYLITSATAGEGKTSLTMSLGLSFAASGLRTLIIDCDLVGRHLTNGFEAAELSGLHEALAQGTMNRIVRRSAAGICVLTAGGVREHDDCALPSAKMAALFREARKHFEVVLVDSGPILGSVEAAVIAPEVDGAILTVVRGQNRGLVRHAVQRLRSLRVQTTGFVYNRAKPMDFHASPFGSSTYSAGSIATNDDPASSTSDAGNSGASEHVDTERAKLARFGPLVDAMASVLPGQRWN